MQTAVRGNGFQSCRQMSPEIKPYPYTHIPSYFRSLNMSTTEAQSHNLVICVLRERCVQGEVTQVLSVGCLMLRGLQKLANIRSSCFKY